MMDYSAILGPALHGLGWVIPFLILAAFLKSPWFKGKAGEFRVNLSAGLSLGKEYRLLKNLTLPTACGTTQIDHVIVSRYGIFVVETKNYTGWIFGAADQRQWTQAIFGQKHRFQNPLHQNHKHVKVLEELLGLPPHAFFPVVVFAGDATFKTEMPENVVYAGGLSRYVKSKTQTILHGTEVERITRIIENRRLAPGFGTDRLHVKNLKASRELPRPGQAPRCPRCGADMVLRTATKGANAGGRFWGCTGFPRCKGVRNA